MNQAISKHQGDFHSKILLFGEYSIIQDSMGLSIPYENFKGRLSFAKAADLNDEVTASQQSLQAFALYLEALAAKNHLKAPLDLSRLKKDLLEGLYFDSSIPQGFGVGSSGALCAALYDRYADPKIPTQLNSQDEILILKEMFSQMESYFHGTSSGMDPLICYLNLPVLIEDKTHIGTVDLPASAAGKGAIFLLDTGLPGKTAPLVQLFMDKCKQNEFLDLCRQHFIPYNDNCIKDFLKGETKALFYNLYFLSKFLLENLTPMVPKMMRKVWKQGLDTRAFYLKLCGSGGGGFILGFTEDLDKAQEYLKDYSVKVIHRF